MVGKQCSANPRLSGGRGLGAALPAHVGSTLREGLLGGSLGPLA